ncbi:U3 small nucleolar RNA-interacting protein 2 [Zancudomyces culisetae]|uniref:U3 small nucleolar RNA-interacting protein 2 n=1 Tax=Zancudomyces culisetae TaxID=1213189 RepID=A0A1R1PDF8_ZANCU|nr:U3 small nucleolar RNA-interacting protein 2 [Zancudomyces culisetae]OMH79583.1 U3 small nucleolar RNA-interacting protein 2 [Zancudomyces culisetae]OMH80154.1 U3 small nucleolar RNA-interacting protein 2 [Zancudomyces culisetae]|eukprot:OMH79007.1 U3 small nucleolar RNA-interacting protein 2 [Zancudomyces culisetae]
MAKDRFFALPGEGRKRKAPTENKNKGKNTRDNTKRTNNKSRSFGQSNRGKVGGGRGGKFGGGRSGDRKRGKFEEKYDDEEVDSDDLEGEENEEPGSGAENKRGESGSEEVSSSEEDSEEEDGEENGDYSAETAAQKRLEVARAYVENLKKGAEMVEGFDAADIDRDIIAERLQDDLEKTQGRIYKRIADSFKYTINKDSALVLKNGHHLAVTCTTITEDGKYVFSGSKDGSIAKWEVSSGKKINSIKGQKKTCKDTTLGHRDQVYCMAVSSDGKYLATGGKDKLIHIWNAKTMDHLAEFKQHKDAVTGLVFRKGHNQLYSCSLDRMVKLWNVDELGYMETLFGHLDSITGISTIQRDQAVTVGARDKSARLWKIVDETQMVFRAGVVTEPSNVIEKIRFGELDVSKEDELDLQEDMVDQIDLETENNNESSNGKAERVNRSVRSVLASFNTSLRLLKSKKFREGSVDCVAMIDEETFVTGGDSGAICLWSFRRKKPIFTFHLAHGVQKCSSDGSDSDGYLPNWISSLCAIPLTDLFVSGSNDGYLRLWKINSNKLLGFSLVNVIPIDGYINDVAIHEADSSKNKSSKFGSSLAAKSSSHPHANDNPVILSPSALTIAVAVGQEPRLGRWNRIPTSKNSLVVYKLYPKSF